MTWVLIAGFTWLVLAVVVALVVGRAVHLAEQPSSPSWLDDREGLATQGAGASGVTVLPGPRRATGGRPTRTPTR